MQAMAPIVKKVLDNIEDEFVRRQAHALIAQAFAVTWSQEETMDQQNALLAAEEHVIYNQKEVIRFQDKLLDSYRRSEATIARLAALPLDITAVEGERGVTAAAAEAMRNRKESLEAEATHAKKNGDAALAEWYRVWRISATAPSPAVVTATTSCANIIRHVSLSPSPSPVPARRAAVADPWKATAEEKDEAGRISAAYSSP